MLRFSVEVTRIDKNRNECNRGTTQAKQKGREAKLRWCGYVQKRRSDILDKGEMELPGRRGRPQSRFMDVVMDMV